MGHTLLMGRRTFNSLGNRPLLGRFNVVVSSKLKEESGRSETNLFFIDQVESEPFFEETTTFVIGGSRLYQHYMGIASKIYATIVEKEFNTFDTFFPPIIGYKIESVSSRAHGV
jgi:dihydrofolate reductase